MTYNTELYSLFIEHIFDFRLPWLELPVFEKQPISGFLVPIGSGKVPHAIARVKLYMPSKFYANRSIRLGEHSLSHIKCNSS